MGQSLGTALVDKEVELFGELWLAEVQDERGTWKDIQGWKDQYEPSSTNAKKHDAESVTDPQSSAPQTVTLRTMAVDLALDKLQQDSTTNLMNVMMEVSATFLGQARDELPTAADNQELAHDMSQILSSMSAILLSYRFDDDSITTTRKFAFIRKEACRQLTRLFHARLQEKTVPEISGEIRTILTAQNQRMRTLILQQFELLVKLVDGHVNQKAQEVASQVDTAVVVANGAVAVANGSKGDTTTNVTIDQAKIKAEQETLLQQKDILMTKFATVFQELLLGKMERLDQMIQSHVDAFLLALDAAQKVTETAANVKGKTPEELTEAMVPVLEQRYQEAKEAVSSQVQAVLLLVRALLITDDNDDAKGTNENDGELAGTGKSVTEPPLVVEQKEQRTAMTNGAPSAAVQATGPPPAAAAELLETKSSPASEDTSSSEEQPPTADSTNSPQETAVPITALKPDTTSSNEPAETKTRALQDANDSPSEESSSEAEPETVSNLQ
jgi:hypothetical protein